MGLLGDILGLPSRAKIIVPKRSRRVMGKMAGDVGETLGGIPAVAQMVSKAVIHDAPSLNPQVALWKGATNLIRGNSPGEGFHRPSAIPTLGAQMVVGNTGYQARALGEDPEDAPLIMGRDGKLYRNDKGGGLSYLLRGVLPNVPKDVLEEARKEKRGLSLLSEDPLNVPLAFLPLAGGAGRTVMVGKLAKNIQRANNTSKAHVFTKAKSLKNEYGLTSEEALTRARATMPKMSTKTAHQIARKEINRPGYAARHGFEGGIPDRIIKGQYGEAEGRMRSRSSMGRGMQRGWDALSERIDARPEDSTFGGPESRWSSSSRAQSAQNKRADRIAKRNENAVTEVEIILSKALGRNFYEKLKNADLTQNQHSMMAAVQAALEHGDLTIEEAVQARLQMYESVLRGGVSSSMTENDIAKLGAMLEKQMDDLTDDQRGIIGAYAGDLKRARSAADIAEAHVERLATRRTPEERQAIRERLKLSPHVKRSEKEFVALRGRLEKLKREHEDLINHIEDLMTRPGLAPSKRNRGLSTATRQLQKKNDQLVKTRQEFRDALAWGHDVSDEERRAGYVQDIAEGGAENQLFDARRGYEGRRRGVQMREHRLEDREAQSNVLLENERASLDKAFDDMVANPRKSRPVTEIERRRIEHEMSGLRHALENPASEVEFRRAVGGMKELAEWADELGRRIAKLGLDEEGQAAIDAGFDARQQLVGGELVRRGILTQDQANGAYFPHYSMWSRGGAEVGRGHGVNGPIVNGPNLNDWILNMKENDLQLMQTGMVDISPTTLGNLVRNRLRYLSGHEAVQQLYKEGKEPPYLLRDIKMGRGGWTLIRNPDQTPRKASDRLRMAYEDQNKLERNVAKEGADTPYSDEVAANAEMTQAQKKAMDEESARQVNAKDIADGPDPDGTDSEFEADMYESVWDGKGERPDWARDTKNFRVIPTRVAKARLGEAVRKAPDNDAMALLNTINMMLRGTILYAPYLGTRYVTRNMIQNATLLALTQPGAFKHVTEAVSLQLGNASQKERFRRIATEGGTVQAQAGLPDIKDTYQTGLKKRERQVATGSSKVANLLGDVADEPFRVAAWINYAKRYDFDTPEEWDQLLTDPKHSKLRDEISQRVREDLYDFDTASPAERAIMNRIFFLYPFIRASTKWPFMYAREYPVRNAVLATMSHEAPQEDEYSTMPQSVKESSVNDGKNWSIWDPWNPARNQIENARSVMSGTMKDQGGEGLLDNLHPILGLVADYLAGNPTKDQATRLIPFRRQIEDVHRGGTDIGKQTEMFMGMEIRPPAHIRQEYVTEAAKLTTALRFAEKTGQTFDVPAIQATFDAWKDWKAVRYRAERAKKDQGKQLQNREIAVIFAEFLGKYGIPAPTEDQILSANEAQLSTWRRQMETKVFGPITKPVESLTTSLRELMLKGYTLEDISDRIGVDVTGYDIK